MDSMTESAKRILHFMVWMETKERPMDCDHRRGVPWIFSGSKWPDDKIAHVCKLLDVAAARTVGGAVLCSKLGMPNYSFDLKVVALDLIGIDGEEFNRAMKELKDGDYIGPTEICGSMN